MKKVSCILRDFELFVIIVSQHSTSHNLTHWGRVTHICVSKLTIIGSDNGLSPDRRQAIIWTNTGLLLIGPLGTNFSEFLIKILTFSFKKMRLKVSSAKRRTFCLGLNELNVWTARRCPKPQPWGCSKGKVTLLAQYPIDLLHFHFTSMTPTIAYFTLIF